MKKERTRKEKEYIVIVGARPNFIKAAPFFRRSSEYPHLKFTLVHTGQHFDENMSQVFFEQMGIPRPDIQLDIRGEFHTEKIGKMFSSLKKVIENNASDGIIVFGDINSTLAGAVASASQGKSLIHIEAGLRSHDRRMPEEINRAITDHLSDLLLATEQTAVDNLIQEGVPRHKISLVGNIMIESIELFKDHFGSSQILKQLGLNESEYVVATIHRAENTDEKHVLENILNILNSVSVEKKVVLPLHPGTRKKIHEFSLSHLLKDLTIIEPLGYIDFMKLVIDSSGVITDSGGIQEETSHLGVPCCTLRDNTERPITIELGSNKLFPIGSMDSDEILRHLNRKDFRKGHIPLWDSEVSRRILDLL